MRKCLCVQQLKKESTFYFRPFYPKFYATEIWTLMCDDDAKTPIVSDYLPCQYQKLANILLSLSILAFFVSATLFTRLNWCFPSFNPPHWTDPWNVCVSWPFVTMSILMCEGSVWGEAINQMKRIVTVSSYVTDFK